MADQINESRALEIYTEIDFDKDDVATIAVAEAEARIRKTIQNLMVQTKQLESDIQKMQDKFYDIGDALIKTKFTSKIQTIKDGLIKTKVPHLDVRIHSNIKTVQWLDLKQNSELSKKINAYSITIVKKSKDNQRVLDTITVEDSAIAINKEQRDLTKSIHDADNRLRTSKSETIDWRRKLSDIPTLERQVKAKLAKDHLSKSKEGKALINGLINDFDNTVKLLGM
jgi:hypothetical protein